MEHSRSAFRRAIPKVGDTVSAAVLSIWLHSCTAWLSSCGAQMVTNKRRPILTLLEDTCGVHDTLMSGRLASATRPVLPCRKEPICLQCSVRHLPLQRPGLQV